MKTVYDIQSGENGRRESQKSNYSCVKLTNLCHNASHNKPGTETSGSID